MIDFFDCDAGFGRAMVPAIYRIIEENEEDCLGTVFHWSPA